MVKNFSVGGLAAALLVGGSVAASAGFIDFTDKDAYNIRGPFLASGTVDGRTWTLTPGGVAGSRLSYPDEIGEAPGSVSVAGGYTLAGDFDGVGVKQQSDDDEISNTPPEWVTVRFNRPVTITGAFFLDLFISPPDKPDGTKESALLYKGAPPSAGVLQETFEATEVFGSVSPRLGLGEFIPTGPFTGTVFSFDAGAGNDSFGAADYALAALEIAAIPVPAGVLLLTTALGGLGFAGYRRRG